MCDHDAREVDHCSGCEQFAALFRSTVVGVISGEEDRILQANDTFLSMVGRSRDDLAAGLDWVAMTPPEYLEQDRQGIEQLRRGEVLPVVEKEYLRPDGTRVPVLIGGGVIQPDPYRWVSVVVDVSDRRRLERQLVEAEQQALRARLDAAAAVVRKLQQSLLPGELPRVDGVEMLGRYLAAADDPVGGDWYDGFVTARGRVAVTVGDVAGHGLAATRAMSELRTATLMAGLIEQDATAILGHVHRYAQHLLPGMFATALLTLYEPASGRLSWARAGHPPPLVVRRGGRASWLEGRAGPPVGVGAGRTPFHEADLGPGDTLVMLTDGLVERRSEPITDGLERLRAALEGCDRLDLADMWGVATHACLPGGEPADDVCMVLVRPTR